MFNAGGCVSARVDREYEHCITRHSINSQQSTVYRSIGFHYTVKREKLSLTHQLLRQHTHRIDQGERQGMPQQSAYQLSSTAAQGNNANPVSRNDTRRPPGSFSGAGPTKATGQLISEAKVDMKSIEDCGVAQRRVKSRRR
jgi:hypothetical protein